MNLGDKTIFGTLSAIHSRAGERSYFFTDKNGSVTLVPGDLVEREYPGTLPEWMNALWGSGQKIADIVADDRNNQR